MEKDPLDNNIKLYFHCALCMAEKPADQSPMEYQRIQAGWTKAGFQVWCLRHEVNIIHVDFEGAKHPAYLQARPPKGGITH